MKSNTPTEADIRNIMLALAALVVLSSLLAPTWMFWFFVLLANTFSFWLMYQGHRTKKDLDRVIEAVFSLPNWEEERAANLGEDCWQRHIWMRLTLRNPWELYTPAVQARLGVMS